MRNNNIIPTTTTSMIFFINDDGNVLATLCSWGIFLVLNPSFKFKFVSCTQSQWPNTSLLSETHDVVNKTHTDTSQKTTKQRHHGPPNPPAPVGSNFTGECDRRTSCDRSRPFQLGDVTFIDETNKFSILLTNILYAAAQRARGQKVSF